MGKALAERHDEVSQLKEVTRGQSAEPSRGSKSS